MQCPACTDSTVVERGDHRFTVAPLVASTVLAGLVGWKTHAPAYGYFSASSVLLSLCFTAS